MLKRGSEPFPRFPTPTPACQCSCRCSVSTAPSRLYILPRTSSASASNLDPSHTPIAHIFALFGVSIKPGQVHCRFRGGRRRASPVAWRVLVTVLPLSRRRSRVSCQPAYDPRCCLHSTETGSASGASTFRGYLCIRLRCGPVTRNRPFDDYVDGLQVIGFPPPCHPSYQASGSCPGRDSFPAEHASLRWTHFRTAGFPQYGSKAGLSDGAFPSGARSARRLVCPQPSCRLTPQ